MCEVGNLDMIKLLLNIGADARADNDGSLRCASYYCNVDTLPYVNALLFIGE